MTYSYPRQRRRIMAISGIFDDFHNAENSGLRWFETFTSGNVEWGVVAAPGGVGGNALWVKGTIGDALANLNSRGQLSPYPNTSYQYLNPPNKPFRTKNRAEFRMRIADDQTSPNALLSHCANFVLDGAVKFSDNHNLLRTAVCFSVANQRLGVKSGTNTVLTSVAWTGSLDTYYDVKIEWETNWFDYHSWLYCDWEFTQLPAPLGCHQVVTIKVYINNSEVLDYDMYRGQWRDTSNTDFPQSMDLGRPGIGVDCENDDTGEVSNGTFVEAYFKDILITQDVKAIDWSATNSVIAHGAARETKARIFSTFPDSIHRGQDIQIFARNRVSDDWTNQFRGIIRGIVRDGKIVTVEADGYDSVLASEWSESLSFTDKTASEIIDESINTPEEKVIFDVSTYFTDALVHPINRYDKNYPHIPKLDILMEMANLEDMTLYLDVANAFHFEKFDNDNLFTDVHIEHGIDFADYKEEEIFLHTPNVIRVIGSGVVAQKEIAAEHYVSGSTVVREISRLDLTTQEAVDESLEYYVQSYLESYRQVTVDIPAKFEIQPSEYIRITINEMGYNWQFAYVLSVTSTMKGSQTVTILSNQYDITTFLTDLNYRQTQQEGENFPQDLIDPDTKTITIDGVATLDISARYMIVDFDYTDEHGWQDFVYRDGKAVITNHFLEQIIALFQTDAKADAPELPERIVWGTGDTPPKENDLTLESYQNEFFCGLADYQGNTCWGNVGGGVTEVGTVTWMIRNSESVANWTNVTELGLTVSAGASSPVWIRASWDEPITNDTGISFKVIIAVTLTPRPGACYITRNLTFAIGNWLDSGKTFMNDFPQPKRMAFFGTDAFPYPSIWFNETSEAGGKMVTCPATEAQGALVTNPNIEKFMIEYSQEYVFDYSQRYDSADGDQRIVLVGTIDLDNQRDPNICMFLRTTKMLSELDGWTTKIKIYLKFARVDPAIRINHCVPRIEEGECIEYDDLYYYPSDA